MALLASGTVHRLYPQDDRVYIALNQPQTEPKPKQYFVLHTGAVFQISVDLALSAAERGKILHIRTVHDIVDTENADIAYLSLDF
jgi:hypothetical protein